MPAQETRDLTADELLKLVISYGNARNRNGRLACFDDDHPAVINVVGEERELLEAISDEVRRLHERDTPLDDRKPPPRTIDILKSHEEV